AKLLDIPLGDGAEVMRAKLFSEASRMLSANRGTWPKVLPVLSDEQQRIREDFMHYWHEVLPQRYGVVEQFNHRYPLRSRPLNTDCRTLEIGAGLG
ncbi:hypothetical protein ACKI1Q_43835, partial [Streptomyces galilaeus]|uniref:hypothetical protein n=1 Tax=Streptomyces galilaeus TaxID=33899 RepID=UPI0038F75C43